MSLIRNLPANLIKSSCLRSMNLLVEEILPERFPALRSEIVADAVSIGTENGKMVEDGPSRTHLSIAALGYGEDRRLFRFTRPG